MTATVTDLFCGAGGSSLGARSAGFELVMAANHWATAIDVHQVHFPDAAHDCADITQVDPRRYPRTNVLIASPECTNHSQARGVSRKRQMSSLFDDPDPAAERSRATMWDVVRFAEQMRYDAIVVENVVEATKWGYDGNGGLWRAWHEAMKSLGYDHRVLSHNSMHHGVPQSRDRIYVVFWQQGLTPPDLELELQAHCPRCERPVVVRQGWKNGKRVGRYRQQWVWNCTTCGTVCEPSTEAAATIIDWELACPRIGDRKRPLAEKTRARIRAGLQRYGWLPVVTAGAGNTHERTPGNRARPVTDPLRVQTGTAEHALATPPRGLIDRAYGSEGGDPGRHVTPTNEPLRTQTAAGSQFLVQPAHGGHHTASRVKGLDEPLWTVTASDDRPALVLANNFGNVPGTVDDPLPTATTGNRHGLVVPLRSNGEARSTSEAVPTVTAGGNHHGLLMRNNVGGAEMVTPVEEPARTMTTKGHQSLLMPYYGQGQVQPVQLPVPTVPTRDRFALLDPDEVIDDCGFRMLEPHEIAAAMAFPAGYIPTTGLTKRDRVKLAGNAVTPPVMAWILGRVLQALETA